MDGCVLAVAGAGAGIGVGAVVTTDAGIDGGPDAMEDACMEG